MPVSLGRPRSLVSVETSGLRRMQMRRPPPPPSAGPHATHIEACKAVSPNQIMHLPPEELQANLNIVAAEGVPFPEQSKAALVSIVVARELEAAGHSKDCARLDKCAKPWADAKLVPFALLGDTTWVLAALGISDEEKFNWFQDAAFTSDLCPMIETGELKVGAVARFCAAMLSAWVSDMKTTEVSDTIVSCLEATLRACRTLGILVNFELHSLFDDGVWDNLEYMKKSTATTNRDLEVLVALSIADRDFYNSRMQKLLRAKAFMMEHSASMEEHLAFFSALSEDFTLSVAQEVKAALARLSVYRAELPEDLIKPSLGVASKRVVAFTRSGATKPAGYRVGFPPASLSEVCAEMSTCFALDAEVDELVTQIAELTASLASAGIEQSAVTLLEQIAAARTPRMSRDIFETLMAGRLAARSQPRALVVSSCGFIGCHGAEGDFRAFRSGGAHRVANYAGHRLVA